MRDPNNTLVSLFPLNSVSLTLNSVHEIKRTRVLKTTVTYSLWFMPLMVVCMLLRSLVRPWMVFSSCLIFSVSPGQKERKVWNVLLNAVNLFAKCLDMFFSQLLILTVIMFPDLDHFAVIKETHSSLRFSTCDAHNTAAWASFFNVMTIWCFQGFKSSRPLLYQRPHVFFHSWGIKTQKIKNILWFVCNFTFSSPLPTTCVRDTSLRCPLWSTVAVLPGVTMATPPLHFRHHLVSYFISRSPVRPIAEDEKGVCETTSRLVFSLVRPRDPFISIVFSLCWSSL